MRANLDKDEKLVPPRNIERGLLRLKQLRHEIKRLGAEIMKNEETATDDWLARAKKNKALLRSEYLQLIRWIAEKVNPVPACYAAAGVLCAAHASGAADAAPCNAREYQP